MNISSDDPLYSLLMLTDTDCSEQHNNITTWKFSCIRMLSGDKNAAFIQVLDSKYLLASNISNSLYNIIGVFNLEQNLGIVYPESMQSIELINKVSFTTHKYVDINYSTIPSMLDKSMSIEQLSYDILSKLMISKEFSGKSPDELAIKSVKLALSYNKSITNIKEAFRSR